MDSNFCEDSIKEDMKLYIFLNMLLGMIMKATEVNILLIKHRQILTSNTFPMFLCFRLDCLKCPLVFFATLP